MPIQISSEDKADISWKCKICKESFVTEDLARQHVLLFHMMEKFEELAPKDKKIFTCDKCFKYSTVSRISFIKHLGMIHQIVPEEQYTQHIEKCKTLLLDIDVIKCSCHCHDCSVKRQHKLSYFKVGKYLNDDNYFRSLVAFFKWEYKSKYSFGTWCGPWMDWVGR